VSVKRQRITGERGREFLMQLATLNFKIDQPPRVSDFPRLHALADSYELTAYEVAYLDLAKRLSLPLTTRDHDLKEAALAEQIELLRQ
jgi:predicted nucleic acid-binding protein